MYICICIYMYMHIFVQIIFQTGKCRYLFAKVGSPTHNSLLSNLIFNKHYYSHTNNPDN